MAAGLAGLQKVYTAQAAEVLNLRGTACREQLNGICRESGAPLQFTGIGSLMNAHVTAQAIHRPPVPSENQRSIKSLLFFHLIERGFYIAPRGFVTISMPVTDKDLQAFAQAVQEFARRCKDLAS